MLLCEGVRVPCPNGVGCEAEDRVEGVRVCVWLLEYLLGGEGQYAICGFLGKVVELGFGMNVAGCWE